MLLVCMEIVEINQNNLTDIKKSNQLYEIMGKIKPAFANGIWSAILKGLMC